MTNKEQRRLRKLLKPTEIHQLEVCFEAYDRATWGQLKVPEYYKLEKFLTECLDAVRKAKPPVDEEIAA